MWNNLDTSNTHSGLHNSTSSIKSASSIRSCLKSNADDPSAHDRLDKDVHVSFTEVKLCQFERILGDNPSVSSGVPVALGAKLVAEETLTVEEFEESRREAAHAPIRKPRVLSKVEREDYLREFGYGRGDLQAAMKAIARERKKRKLSSRVGLIERLRRRFHGSPGLSQSARP